MCVQTRKQYDRVQIATWFDANKMRLPKITLPRTLPLWPKAKEKVSKFYQILHSNLAFSAFFKIYNFLSNLTKFYKQFCKMMQNFDGFFLIVKIVAKLFPTFCQFFACFFRQTLWGKLIRAHFFGANLFWAMPLPPASASCLCLLPQPNVFLFLILS